jgi:hypothetical protein
VLPRLHYAATGRPVPDGPGLTVSVGDIAEVREATDLRLESSRELVAVLSELADILG